MATAPRKIPPPPTWPFTTRPGRKPRAISGLLLSLLGWVLPFVATPTLMLLLDSLNRQPDWLVGPGVPAIRVWLFYLLGVMVLVAALFSVRIITMGRQLRQEDALALLTRDERAPILLLRSFLDDTLYDPSVQSGQFVRARYEERLGAALRGLGPVIAVGKPGESLPQTGAARLYVEDREWQTAIDFFLRHSAAVVITVGRSSGVWWEIEYVIGHVPRSRILFLFPYVESRSLRESPLRAFYLLMRVQTFTWRRLPEMRAEREARYDLFRQSLAQWAPDLTFPDSLGSAQFVDFDSSGQPRLLGSVLPLVTRLAFGRRGKEVQVISMNTRKTLRPFLEKVQGLDA